MIANKKSGQGKGGGLAEIVRKHCEELGHELIVHDVDQPGVIERRAQEAIDAAEAAGNGVVIAAGGDGTLRTVAHLARDRNVRFAVVPCGTFNYFARSHRIPEDLEEAVRLALTGEASPVRVGDMNGETFLINASMGLYAKAIREREQNTKRFGRNRLVAILSTISTFLDEHRLLDVELVTGGQSARIRTPMIFIGNSALQLRNVSLNVAKCMKSDLLAAVIMRPLKRGQIWSVIFHGVARMLEREEALESFCIDSLNIHTRSPVETVALDGELFKMKSPLRITSCPGVLQLVKPPPEPQAASVGA